jgi:hypothetical protein
MDEVVIQYQLTWREWRRVYWGVSTKRSAYAFILVFLFVFGLSTLAVAQSLALVIVVAVFAAQYVVWTFWIAPRRYWNSAIGVQEAKRVVISDEGVRRASTSLDERFGWDRFSAVKIAKRYVIFLGRPGTPSVFLPRRGLSSADDERALRRLIDVHLPHS